MNDTLSAPIERLRIVSDEDLEFGTYAIAKRVPRRYPDFVNEENDLLPAIVPSKTAVFGAYLLSGIAYCAHCGKKLVGTYHTKHYGNMVYHRPVYRCYNGEIKAKNCAGQRTYSGAKIENAVKIAVGQYLRYFQQTVDDQWRERARTRLRQEAMARVGRLESTLERLIKEQDGLKKEILKAIAGTSDFDRGLLKEMLEENKNAQLEAEENLQKAKQEVAREEENFKQLEQQYQHITAWANEFEDADVDRQKMILARLIERIEVGKGYDIEIKFFLSQDTFVEAVTAYKAS